MSYDATNWAIKQRGIRPAAKIVLWHLCDRFHPDHGCFPSQSTLAHDCEMSRASINRCIDELEKAGLVKRHPRVDPKTKKQTSTSYTFAFQKTVSQNDTRGKVAVSQNDEKPCLKYCDSRVSNCDTNVVREPIREQVTARERAPDLFSAESETEHQRETGSDGFDRFWAVYPKKAAKKDAQKAWAKAIKRETPDRIVSAAEKYAAWLSSPSRPGEFKPHPKNAQGWLNGDRWQDFLDDAAPETFREEDLSAPRRSMLQDGICPPSMKGADDKPNAEARYWLKRYGHEVKS